MSFSRSELICRHTPCERHPPEPVQDVDPLKLEAESDTESPTVVPGPDLLMVSEVKTEEEVQEDDIAPPDPVVKFEEGPGLIKRIRLRRETCGEKGRG